MADPLVVRTLQLDVECREIEDVLAKAPFGVEVQFQVRRAVRLDDFVQALNDHATTVLQFSGHGVGPNGICLHGGNGRAANVSIAAFVDLIVRAAGDDVDLVVLNACHTEDLARELVRHFPCVVGTPAAIGDEAAIAYSRSLHRALASGRSVANAHEQGAGAARHARALGLPRDVTAADAAPPADVAMLLTRPDVDPTQIFITGPEARRPPPAGAPGRDSHGKRRGRASSARTRP
jgi:hypothetical protein